MISLDILLTGLIVAAAVAWAGRSLWRWLRRRSRNAATVPSCGGAAGGCGNCPVGETQITATPDDGAPCGDHRPDES